MRRRIHRWQNKPGPVGARPGEIIGMVFLPFRDQRFEFIQVGRAVALQQVPDLFIGKELRAELRIFHLCMKGKAKQASLPRLIFLPFSNPNSPLRLLSSGTAGKR